MYGSTPIRIMPQDANTTHFGHPTIVAAVTPLVRTMTTTEHHHRYHGSASPAPSKALREHLGKNRQYWRDIILGVNDGLVSTFLLIVGVSGGNLSTDDILLTAIAGALAGMISMSAGEFVATKAQNEVFHGELALERQHIAENNLQEVAELSNLLPLIGIQSSIASHHDNNHDSGVEAQEGGQRRGQENLHQQLRQFYADHPDALLQLMKALEFGIVDDELRSPCWAAITSGGLFCIGSLPSVLPYAFVDTPSRGLLWATCLTLSGLFVVGGVKTWATRGSFMASSIENLLIAGVGGGLAYAVGYLFDLLLRSA